VIRGGRPGTTIAQACGVRTKTLSILSLLSVLCLAPDASASKPDRPTAAPSTAIAASSIDLEIVEVEKDGTRRTVVLSLALPDQADRPGSELTTRVQQGERGEPTYYWAKVDPMASPEGTRYAVSVKRGDNREFNGPSMRVEVARTLKTGVVTQLSRVVRPDGSASIVTATVH
jgi:hypothetical protein